MYAAIAIRNQTGVVLALSVLLFACSSSKHKGATGTSGAGGSNAVAGTAAGSGHATGGTTSAGSGGTKVGSSGAGGSSTAAASGGSGKSGNGSSATGGNTNTGGSGGSSGSTGPSTGSVLERNNHPSRDGLFIQPTLTKAAVAKFASDTSFKATFGGNTDNMWASPLYLENGPGGKGVFIAVSTGNNIFALDETTGKVVWMRNVGSSPTETGAGCGSIKPLGIISTPVIDATARTIYVGAAIGTSNIARHEIHALSADDGSERTGGWPLDVTTLSSGSVKFSPQPQNQRSALSLVNGTVYVAYGGHVGDCGNYHGWVVGVDAKDATQHGAWATLGTGEAIWAAGGMASDGTSVFPVTGNNTTKPAKHTMSDGEEVVRISGLATFDRADKNLYYPGSWNAMDSSDADFGASSSLYVTVPGSTPANYVVALSKDGHFYMLDAANLGGMAGHKVDFMISSGTMSVRTVPTAYTTASGLHVAFSTVTGSKCPASTGVTGAAVMSVSIPAGSPPTPTVAWCAAHDNPDTAPITTTTDGTNEAVVWFMNAGKLTALDGDTGKVLYTSKDTCSGVRQWTSPIAVKGRIVVGGDKHLCSWSAH